MAQKFMVQQVDEASHLVDCPDPNTAEWEWMESMQVSLTGRGVQQGLLRVTLKWEIMADEDFGELMNEWFDAMNHGFRFDSITVPTFRGQDNAIYQQYFGSGTPGGYVRMMLPKGTREILHVRDVEVVFEDVLED
jgi:hypothetical protein